MYTEFEKNLSEILKNAGYDRIEPPTHEPWNGKLCFLGKLAGSVAYYYVVYGASPEEMVNFAAQKEFVDHAVAHNSKRIGIRHSVVFNIFAGDLSDNVREIERMISSQGDFSMMEKYDVYYGVDTANSRIMRNMQQPHNMDGALAKIGKALKGESSVKGGDAGPRPGGFAVPVAKHPILCYVIMGINALLFALMEISGGSTNSVTLVEFGAVSRHLVITLGEYHRLITSNFLHIGFMHLALNTGFLVILGMRTERYFGHIKFGIIYLVCGIFSGIASIAVNPEFVIGAGASGSLFGVMGAMLAFMLLRKRQVEGLNAGSLVMLVVVNVLVGFAINQFQMQGAPNIGNAAHIGGLLAGLVLGYFLTGKDKFYKRSEQKHD